MGNKDYNLICMALQHYRVNKSLPSDVAEVMARHFNTENTILTQKTKKMMTKIKSETETHSKQRLLTIPGDQAAA